MSKRAYISRYLLILKKLRAKPYSSYEELKSYIDSQFEFLQMMDDTLNLAFSKRTLQRDLREIRNIYNIDIEYSRADKGYYISQDGSNNMNFERILEAFDMFNSLNLAQDLAPFIHLEKRKPQGTENLYGLLHSIKNKMQIRFNYQKFWEDEKSERTVEPYALKEFKNRWYLLAKDINDKYIKTFAFDRLSDLEILNKPFIYPKTYNIEEAFRNCFGIITPGEPVEDILLSFEPFQGKYIKSLPLHDTQHVVLDNEKELRVTLKLCITHDLVMELLSFGNNMKVLKPKSLLKEVRLAHKKAFEQY